MEKRLEDLRENICRILLIVTAIGVILIIFGVIFRVRVYADSLFFDVQSSDWFYEDVTTVAGEGIIKGYPDGSFKANGTVTYAEYITMVVKAYAGEDPGNSSTGHWASNYYEYGLDKALYTRLDVLPAELDMEIPRGKMAIIISNAIGGQEINDYSIIQRTISDLDPISSNAYHIVQSYGHGILTGYPDGSFKADQTLTRAESATVIRRYIDPSKRKKPDIDKIKDDINKEKDANAYWMNDPDYDELVQWIKDETSIKWNKKGKDDSKISRTSAEFWLENGKFTCVRQGGGVYVAKQPYDTELYPNMNEHIYKTFKLMKEVVDKHNLYLAMGYNDHDNKLTIFVKGNIVVSDYLWAFSFSGNPMELGKTSGRAGEREMTVPWNVHFIQGGYVGSNDFEDFEETMENMRIGHPDYIQAIRDVFVMLYGSGAGDKIMDYALGIYQNDFDYELAKPKRKPEYATTEFDGVKVYYYNDLDSYSRFHIDIPK